MLRRIVVLVGLMTAGCMLGGGIDIPSSDTGPGDGGINLDGGNEGTTDGGLIDGPPIGMPGAGSGGSPCCLPFGAVAGFGGGAGLGGLGGAP